MLVTVVNMAFMLWNYSVDLIGYENQAHVVSKEIPTCCRLSMQVEVSLGLVFTCDGECKIR